MPYPMTRMPTFGEVKTRLIDEFGCSYGTMRGTATFLENGEAEIEEREIPYFEREVDSGAVWYPVVMEEYERMNPTVLRDACIALGIDPREFGLYLG